MKYTCHVSPPVDPQWFVVFNDQGLSTGAPFSTAPTFEPPDAARCDGYHCDYTPSPHWRLATAGETARALFEYILDEDLGPREEASARSGSDA